MRFKLKIAGMLTQLINKFCKLYRPKSYYNFETKTKTQSADLGGQPIEANFLLCKTSLSVSTR